MFSSFLDRVLRVLLFSCLPFFSSDPFPSFLKISFFPGFYLSIILVYIVLPLAYSFVVIQMHAKIESEIYRFGLPSNNLCMTVFIAQEHTDVHIYVLHICMRYECTFCVPLFMVS